MQKTLAGALALIAFALGEPAARAQAVSGATPVHHGTLKIRPAAGSFDTNTGNATLRARRWRIEPSADSNGIFPDREEIVVALGKDSFDLPAGSLQPNRSGKVLRYRASPDAVSRGIRSFRIARRSNGTYLVSFVVVGLNLSGLVTAFPSDCTPVAVIIGDDDGFSGAILTRSSFRSPRVTLPRSCSLTNWPWLQR